MAELPLDGVRVLDLSHVFAGPTCTRILAELGADVIKVEARQRLDISRILIMTDNDTADQPWNRTCYFAVHNAGKRGITLDLTAEQGRGLFSRLIPHCDVLVESFTPRVMKAFELEYETVRQLKPDIIMLSMSGYGQTGPYRDWSAYGMGLEPASGISAATGYRSGPPIRTGMSFTDPLTGVLAAGAVLAALRYRQHTGRGQFIDLSQQEGAMALMGTALMDYQMNGRLAERMGNRSSWAAPQGCYRCRGDDDWLVISVEDDEEWAAFCRATGHPEWAEDERFADVLARHENHDALDMLIEGWTREQDHYEAFHLLQSAGVKAAPALNGKELLLDPHFRERHRFDLVDHPVVGRRPVPRHLVARFGRFEPRVDVAAPLLGQHNREVLQGMLGLSDDELASLEAEGVIGSEPVLDLPEGLTFEMLRDVIRELFRIPLEKMQEMGAVQAVETDYRQQLGLDEPAGGS
jgi:crotonobetainyl-CoA:carnitine CoA-transferase CaiB-like acyl-CoA transferase